jgi:AcrR family transcriptional regulator
MFNFEEAQSKGERTRELIRQTALRSFRERGYEETTVRLIAQETGVSLGSTNYHFPSKNHLVQELYLEVMGEFRTTVTERVAKADDLIPRLRIAFETGIEVLQPYHGFAPGFLSAAMSPKSPINPLSGESEPALAEAIAAFREVVDGSRHRLPADIAAALPDVLIIAYLLLALFFTYDRSPGQRHTHRLLDRALSLLALALPLVRLPALRRPIRELLELVAEVRS